MTPTILVVEDEALVAEDIQKTLTRLGYNVPTTAATGREALGQAERIRPSLALMDIHLRGAMDGIEVASVLRARYGIPIVYLTSYSDEATLARAKQTEPHGYLIKPFEDRELRTAIEVALYRHELERKLAEREQWFSTTLQSIADAVVATDTQDRISFMNAVAEKLSGYKREEAVGKHVDDVLRMVDVSHSKWERDGAARGGESLPPHTELVTKSGERIAIDDVAAPIVCESGNVLGGVVVFRDMTERRKLEKRLSRAERLASLGTMVSVMAHEINNPLAYVVANIGYCAEGVTEAMDLLENGGVKGNAEQACALLRELSDALKDASEGAERVRKIVMGLRNFGQVGSAHIALDLPSVLDAAVGALDKSLHYRGRLSLAYGATPRVDADDGLLVQVFTQLLTFAAQTQTDVDKAHEVRVTTSTDEQGRAVVEIRDTGRGLGDAEAARLFEPMPHKDEEEAGVGVRLSICQDVIASLGGTIAFDSAVGRGSVFKVVLPVGEKPPESSRRWASVAPAAEGK